LLRPKAALLRKAQEEIAVAAIYGPKFCNPTYGHTRRRNLPKTTGKEVSFGSVEEVRLESGPSIETLYVQTIMDQAQPVPRLPHYLCAPVHALGRNTIEIGFPIPTASGGFDLDPIAQSDKERKDEKAKYSADHVFRIGFCFDGPGSGPRREQYRAEWQLRLYI
jgi:hypothetical protein